MASVSSKSPPAMPWVDFEEDRGFRWFAIIMLVLFLAVGLILNSITLPEIEQKSLVDISPRLAKLLLEKQKVKPPEPKALKKEIPKKEELKKDPVKKKEVKKEVKKESAREVAKQSGLIALSDELQDLRDSFDLDNVIELPQQDSGKKEIKIASNSNLLTSAASSSSGGIKADTLNRNLNTSELASRKTTTVESKLATSEKQQAKVSTSATKTSGSKRSTDEIERVFQKNKGRIYSIYQRALRKNPSLMGKVVLELVIEPNGSVSKVTILSSELNDSALERKLVLRIKKFKFSTAKVAAITVTYPIDFLPS